MKIRLGLSSTYGILIIRYGLRIANRVLTALDNEYSSPPIPPQENRLSAPIRAGEKKYHP
jgi:hypothetical protein